MAEAAAAARSQEPGPKPIVWDRFSEKLAQVVTRDRLVEALRAAQRSLFAPRDLRGRPMLRTGNASGVHVGYNIIYATRPGSEDVKYEEESDSLGIGPAPTSLLVSNETLIELLAEIQDENSEVRRLSTAPVERAFVYLDVSDFSKMSPGREVLVIQAINDTIDSLTFQGLFARHGVDFPDELEARLCIGDGYIYVFTKAISAAWFAAVLATLLQFQVANKQVAEFHFRMGAHFGPVLCFWDPGRDGWNYLGDGINDSARVLQAVPKEIDDVLYISGAMFDACLQAPNAGPARAIRNAVVNRGRRKDKHDKPHRVYELLHFQATSDLAPNLEGLRMQWAHAKASAESKPAASAAAEPDGPQQTDSK